MGRLDDIIERNRTNLSPEDRHRIDADLSRAEPKVRKPNKPVPMSAALVLVLVLGFLIYAIYAGMLGR